MGYSTTLILALALFYQHEFVESRACNGRSTVIQVRVPQKTNVTIKYPSQIDPVQFVPRPSEPDPQCFKCSNSKCQKCNKFNPSARTMPNRSSMTRTNIVIDLKGHHTKNENTKKDIYDTLLYVGDKNSASSVSNSTAKSTEGGAASTSAAATTTNSALIAAFNENANNGSSPGNTENVYLEDTSQSSAKSSASASAGKPEPEEIILEEPKTAAVQEPPSKQQPQADQVPGQQTASEQQPPPAPVPASGQQLVPEKEAAPASEQQTVPEQNPASGQISSPKSTLEEATAVENQTPQKAGEETNLDKDKTEPLNPTPKVGNDKELEKPTGTVQQADAADAVPSSPKEIEKPEESAKELNSEAKKEENNVTAAEATTDKPE